MSYLKWIKLTKFGIHHSFETELVNGLVVVRGSNGSGKSTFTQGILYLFFGISAIDGTVEDLANDDYPSKEMSVEGQYGPFLVKRSKLAATVVRQDRDDWRVAGQNEVSDFFRELFGVAKGAEGLVLVADQDNTAGIVNKKPAETTAFIEQAAGFDQLDNLIEYAKTQLTVVDKDTLEQQITIHNEKIDGLVVEKKELGSRELKLRTDIAVEEIKLEKENSVLESLKNLLITEKEKLTSVTRNNTEVKRLAKELDEKVTELDAAMLTVSELESKEFEVLSESEEEDITEQIKSYNKRVELYNRYQKYLKVRKLYDSFTVVWHGAKDDFVGEYEALLGRREKVLSQKAVLNSELKKLVSHNPSKLTCSECNRDFDNVEELKQHNLEILKRTEDKRHRIVEVSIELDELNEEISTYKEISDNVTELVKAGIADFDVDTSTYPSKPEWSEIIPVKPENNVSDLMAKISDNEKVIKERDKRDNLVKSIKDLTIVTVQTAIDKLEKALSELPYEQDTSQLEAVVKDTEKSVDKKIIEVRLVEDEIAELKKQLAIAENSLELIQKDIDYNCQQRDRLEEKIKQSKLNSKLLSNMRKARTKVISNIWNNITALVSHRFNEVTGKGYQLIKDDKGFKCNTGAEKLRPVLRLSGSEKASMGIAFREVLKMTFAPNCGFIVFDEPFASMDKSRTLSAMSAISNMTGQVIVITHEDTTELVGDQLIEVR